MCVSSDLWPAGRQHAPMQATRQSGLRGWGGFLNSLINTRCSLGNIYTDPVPCPSPPAGITQPGRASQLLRITSTAATEEKDAVTPRKTSSIFFFFFFFLT